MGRCAGGSEHDWLDSGAKKVIGEWRSFVAVSLQLRSSLKPPMLMACPLANGQFKILFAECLARVVLAVSLSRRPFSSMWLAQAAHFHAASINFGGFGISLASGVAKGKKIPKTPNLNTPSHLLVKYFQTSFFSFSKPHSQLQPP